MCPDVTSNEQDKDIHIEPDLHQRIKITSLHRISFALTLVLVHACFLHAWVIALYLTDVYKAL